MLKHSKRCQLFSVSALYTLLLTLALVHVTSFASPGQEPGAQPKSTEEGAAFTEEEAKALEKQLDGMRHIGWTRADAIARKFEGRPVVPVLTTMIQDEDLSAHLRGRAMYVLAMTYDKSGIPVLRSIIEQPLITKVSQGEWTILHDAILCLGPLADDKTLDFLLEMTMEEYWVKRNAEAAKVRQTPDNFRDHMRWMALNSFALSGSPRAIAMFNTGEGLPAFTTKGQRESCLRLAKMRSKGFIRVADYEAHENAEALKKES